MEHRLLAGLVYGLTFAIIGGIFFFFKRDSKFGWPYYLVAFFIANVTMKFVVDPLYYEHKINRSSNNYLSVIQEYYPDIYSRYKEKIVGPSDSEATTAMRMITAEVLKRSLPTADDNAIIHYYDEYNKINKKIYPIDHSFPYFRELGRTSPGFKNLSGDTTKEYFLAINQLILNSINNKNSSKIPEDISPEKFEEISLKVIGPLYKKYKEENIGQLFADLELKEASGDYDLKSQILIDFIDSLVINKQAGADFIRHAYTMN